MAYVAPWLEALPAPLPGNLGKGVMRFDQLEEMKVSMNRGYPKNGWWMENPIEMDDLGVPWFWETPMFQWDDLDLGLELRTTGMKQGQQHHSGVQTKIGQQERLQRTSFFLRTTSVWTSMTYLNWFPHCWTLQPQSLKYMLGFKRTGAE